MLKSMRKHAKYFYVLFFLIIITFVFWGVGPDDNNSTIPIAVVEGERIGVQEYWRAVDVREQAFRYAQGESYDEEMRKNLQEEVLTELLTERVLFIAASRAGFTASDQEVNDAIAANPSFQTQGAFDSNVYQQVLRANRVSPSAYEASIRRSLIVQKLSKLVESSVPASLEDEELKGLSGDPEILKGIKEALLRQKRKEALKAYANGLMRTMEVQINRDQIS